MASGVQPRLGWWFRKWSFNVFHCPVSKFKWDGEIKCFGLLSAVLTTSQLFRFLIISCLMSFWDSSGLLPPGACSQWTCATWPCDTTDFHQPQPSADFQQLPWPQAVLWFSMSLRKFGVPRGSRMVQIPSVPLVPSAAGGGQTRGDFISMPFLLVNNCFSLHPTFFPVGSWLFGDPICFQKGHDGHPSGLSGAPMTRRHTLCGQIQAGVCLPPCNWMCLLCMGGRGQSVNHYQIYQRLCAQSSANLSISAVKALAYFSPWQNPSAFVHSLVRDKGSMPNLNISSYIHLSWLFPSTMFEFL